MLRNFKKYSLLVLTITFIFLSSASAYAQEVKPRSLQSKHYAGQPIEISDVKLNGISIKPNQKFDGNSEWLNGMIIAVKNVSDKPVAYISVMVSAYFEKDGSRMKRNGKETQTGIELRYGIQPARPNEPNFSKGEVLLPNETISLELTKELRDEFNSRLGESSTEEFRGASTDVTEVTVRIYEVSFEGNSDMKWSTGRWLKRDSKNPRLWLPVTSIKFKNFSSSDAN